MNNLPDLNAVRVFAAIVETGGFQAAARRLGLPRSTVSHRIAALERRLGVRLLARTTRHGSVTDAGRAYYEQVRSALAVLDDADRREAGLAEPPRGRSGSPPPTASAGPG